MRHTDLIVDTCLALMADIYDRDQYSDLSF